MKLQFGEVSWKPGRYEGGKEGRWVGGCTGPDQTET
jgi:hypothetical protein